MASKKKQVKQEVDIFNTKVVEGYVIYDHTNKTYLDEDLYSCDEDVLPNLYDDFEEAKSYIEESDYPENLEIHKIKYTLQVEEVYKRKIAYELVTKETE